MCLVQPPGSQIDRLSIRFHFMMCLFYTGSSTQLWPIRHLTGIGLVADTTLTPGRIADANSDTTGQT